MVGTRDIRRGTPVSSDISTVKNMVDTEIKPIVMKGDAWTEGCSCKSIVHVIALYLTCRKTQGTSLKSPQTITLPGIESSTERTNSACFARMMKASVSLPKILEPAASIESKSISPPVAPW